MPQAPDYLRDKWGIDCGPVIIYLKARGFKLTRDWWWIVPENYTPSDDEYSAIDFLIMEWDFGGIR